MLAVRKEMYLLTTQQLSHWAMRSPSYAAHSQYIVRDLNHAVMLWHGVYAKWTCTVMQSVIRRRRAQARKKRKHFESEYATVHSWRSGKWGVNSSTSGTAIHRFLPGDGLAEDGRRSSSLSCWALCTSQKGNTLAALTEIVITKDAWVSHPTFLSDIFSTSYFPNILRIITFIQSHIETETMGGSRNMHNFT